MPSSLQEHLEALYDHYNDPKWISPDPLEVVYDYDTPADREVAGLVAASMAYGQVVTIVRNARALLARVGTSPAGFVMEASARQVSTAVAGFRHRWSTPADMEALLRGAGRMMQRHGGLGAGMAKQVEPGVTTIVPALERWTDLLSPPEAPPNSLVPRPARGSACKRLLMYLRWMVRHDRVDPGGWPIPPSLLVVPVDVHIHRIARALGLTRRNQANLAAALEITEAFRRLAPTDPVRYDFALTRLGIRNDAEMEVFVRACRR